MDGLNGSVHSRTTSFYASWMKISSKIPSINMASRRDSPTSSIHTIITHISEAIEMIISPEMPEDHDLEDERFLEIYQEATDIYGLLHARYITTSKGMNHPHSGLAIMREHLLQGKFGYCPRVYCEK